VDVRFTPLVGPVGAYDDDETSAAPKASSPPVLANPGPMALYSFAFTTCLLMLIETGAVEAPSINLVIGFAAFHGGLVQLVVGFIEIYRNNLFGATAFASYGAFWMGFACVHILEAAGVLQHAAYPDARCAWLTLWGIFTFIMFVQTLFINRCLQAIFFFLAVTFFLLAGGEYNDTSKMAGGVVGIFVAFFVVYTATAELYNDLGSLHLPLGHVVTHKEEYGNSKPGRGAILSKTDPAGVVALRARMTSLQATKEE
jgi:succinate-acetate transporter protein